MIAPILRAPIWRPVALACLLAVSAVGGASSSPAVRVVSFKDGPTVMLAPDSLAGPVFVGLWFEAGARNDPPGMAGMAYVVSRSAFTFPEELRRTLEAQGATFEVDVSADATLSGATLPVEALGVGLETLSSELAAPSLSGDALTAAVARTRSERAQRMQSSPLAPGLEQIDAAVFPGHGYGLPPSGSDEQLGHITLDAARRDLATRFAPSRATITISGRFDPEGALDLLKKRFGPPGAAPPASKPDKPAPFAAPRARTLAGEARVAVPILLMAWRGPADSDPDSPAFEALAHLLVDGSPSWLESHLPASSPILRVQGSFDRRKDASVVVLAAAVKAVVDTAEIESALASLVEQAPRDSITRADVERAQRRLESQLLVAAQSVKGRAETLASSQLMDGDWKLWERRIEQVRSLTPDAVKRVARLFDPSRRAVVWIDSAAPQGQGGGR